MNQEEVLQALAAAGLSRISADLEPLMRSSIGIKTRLTDENSLPMGVSKLGGLPDLPAGLAWPQWKNLPQSFVAQFRLADVRLYDVDYRLPPSGMLYFFYDSQQQTFGHTGADRGGWSVLYQENAASLRRTPSPDGLPANAQFPPRAVEFYTQVTLPQWIKAHLKNRDWKPEEEAAYSQFMADFPAGADAPLRNHLLGHPDELQDDMHLEVHLAAHDLDPHDERAASMADEALNWQLLLQVDSDERVGMKWAEVGRLYYWIEPQALKERHFDKAWLILQSD